MKTKTKQADTANIITEIQIKQIDFSPFNHRGKSKPITDDSLAELAESIKQHKVLQAVLIRPIAENNYQLVYGERRLRASKLAGQKTIPAIIRDLNDEEVKEIQLIENMQREDAHPMEEAQGIALLLTQQNTIAQIASRIGKSVAFVYQRNKLNDLIKPLQEMFIADAITISQAVKIARLDTESQQHLFDNHCADWIENEDFEFYGFDSIVGNYELDLTKAPFNTKDAKLDKSAGACTKCPHNTATTTSLFPEEETNARCTNRPCFENKCRLAEKAIFFASLKLYPDLPLAARSLASVEDYAPLERGLIVDFTRWQLEPVEPVRADFNWYDDEDDNDADFDSAVHEYNTQLKQFEDLCATGMCQKAIAVEKGNTGKIVYVFNNKGAAEESRIFNDKHRAADYTNAAKSKTLTPDIIDAERSRLRQREERSKELDTIKMQEAIYNDFIQCSGYTDPQAPQGASDRAAMIFLIYDVLGWYQQEELLNILFPGQEVNRTDFAMEFLLNATDQQLSFLIRHAMASKAGRESPTSLAGKVFKMLHNDTPGAQQEAIAAEFQAAEAQRLEKLEAKFVLLDKQAEKLTS